MFPDNVAATLAAGWRHGGRVVGGANYGEDEKVKKKEVRHGVREGTGGEEGKSKDVVDLLPSPPASRWTPLTCGDPSDAASSSD